MTLKILMVDGYDFDGWKSLHDSNCIDAFEHFSNTLNSISSIPLIGDLLVGKKVGEGVFGVSFKIKGSPKDLKTKVNPIKTLTPRFITRTLKKIKGEENILYYFSLCFLQS